jgi:phosphate transport system substrate-binding protein
MRFWNQAPGWLVLAALAAAVGCGGAANYDDDDDVSNLVGAILVDGSSTVQPLTTAAAEEFIKIHPQVNIPVATSGTGGGFKKFVKGETDISDASRPISAEEFAQCQQNGIEFLEIPVAYDGLTIVVNPQNDFVDALTVEQIGAIYLAEKAAKTWAEVNPEWPAEPLKPYSPGTDSGTFDYFRDVLGGKSASIRSDMQTNEDDNVLVQGVQSDKGAVAYFGAAYATGDKMKIVPIINPKTNQPVVATEQTVMSGEYFPYSRPMFIYVNAKSLERPEVRLFVEDYLEHAAAHARKVGYFPLPESVLAEAKARVASGAAGTCFITADGKQREGAFIDLYKSDNLVSIK